MYDISKALKVLGCVQWAWRDYARGDYSSAFASACIANYLLYEWFLERGVNPFAELGHFAFGVWDTKDACSLATHGI